MAELTEKAVQKLMKKPGRHAVGPRGLYLQITASPAREWKDWPKSWIFRYQRGGTSRHMGLGAAGRNGIPLKTARDRVIEARQLLSAGIDPVKQRETERAAAKIDRAKAVTFKHCAESYIAHHQATWKNPVHRKQWSSTLETYVYNSFGSLPVSAVDTAMVIKALDPIWTAKPETAGRVRGRIERILDWAKVSGFRAGENPARWRGHLSEKFAKKRKLRKVKHHPAMPYAALPTYMVALRSKESISARALEFTILTAVRTGDTIGGLWSEVDQDKKLWTISAERLKGQVDVREDDHRVPLTEPALKVLNALHRESDFLFPGAKENKPLSNMAMLNLLKGSHPEFTVHGFRSTFRDWAAEETDFPNHVVEMALAHEIGNEVEAAYRRGELLDKRRKLMEYWAAFCAGTP
ncbi:integrase arm-type DNA-binding domain-containing protein [Bradyrhizobium sp. AUGA SZCCT0158]|uniref:tyrosine-type recombinase/integrase n=1 Tax=Bradyrhizobium sp. AUGA SZCCT0158 TaxID=2807661 RepID=UPI001BAA03AA|nr:site-specific integrase [Bradyrhizobium sp. AUGA SZCCT0158]MBR1199336.1 integrase arm-type DNA-binding domain-containing protein [Bradyrhizobium sp. AUGA SZCCT0158]